MKQKAISTMLLVALVVGVASVPATASANTTIVYQPRTNSEMIAYLYGRIAQLLEIKQLLESGATSHVQTAGTFDYVTAETHKALEVTETTAVLRGEVNLYGKATARVWFEYGQDDDFLDQKTRQVSVRSVYDRAVRERISNLEDDERYYFRIVSMSNDGSISYGDIYGFWTDERDE